MTINKYLFIFFLSPLTFFGQNNETVKEVVTVKRVITNNGQNITISEQQATQQIKGTVVVAGDSIVNQRAVEQSIQINDTVNTLDQQTQENASIASQANEVSVKTDTIAKLVVSNANEKEFVGKDTISI